MKTMLNRLMPVWLFAFAGAAALYLAAGCASEEVARETPPPGSGLAEYRQVAVEAEQGMQAALSSLAMVSGQAKQCPPAVLADFSDQVSQLQVKSLRYRERSQAILARGETYFADMHEELWRVKDPAVAARAWEHRTDLEQSFQRIKAWSKDGHEAFQPFLGDLRKVRNALEKDSAALDAGTTRQWLASAKANGESVQSCLGSIQRELDAMQAMLGLQTPAANSK
jgi:hypothetical protein